MGDTRSRQFSMAIAVVVILVVAGTAVWWKPKPKENGVSLKELSPEEVQRLIVLKNLGIAHLENFPNLKTNRKQVVEESLSIFTELSEKLPQELIGPQNLAIARLLILLSFEPRQQPQAAGDALQEAETAMKKLREVRGDTFVVHLLTAKLAREAVRLQLSDNTQRILDEYDRASQLEPENPLPWTELYQVVDSASDQVLRNRIGDSLRKAQELLPENYALLIERLLHGIRERDPSVIQILDIAERKLRLFEGTFQRYRISLPKTISEIREAIERGDRQGWQTALSKIRPIINVVKPEMAYQLDKSRLEKHPLEFLIMDFSEEFYEQVDLPALEPIDSVEVKFVRAAAGNQLPELDSVVDAIFADFDLDGRLDVIVLHQKRIQIFKLKENGWQILAEADLPFEMEHVLAADLDEDYRENTIRISSPTAEGPTAEGKTGSENQATNGQQEADLDLIVYGSGGIRLLKNVLDKQSGNRSLEILSQESGLDELKDVLAACVADLDHEGDLDLVVSTRSGVSIWSNANNFRFVNLSDLSLLPPEGLNATVLIPVDWDQNLNTDILLASGESEETGYLQNNFHNRFRWIKFENDFEHLIGSRSLAFVDADSNTSWDLLSCGKEGISLSLTRTPNSGIVQHRETQKLSREPTVGLKLWDFDNDGFQDFVAWGEKGITVFRGVPKKYFEPVEKLFEKPPKEINTCDVGDFDHDGDEDLLIVQSGKAVIYENQGGNENHWIEITLSAEFEPKSVSQRTNLHGIGSLLELKAGGHYQRRVVTRRTTHLGLGRLNRADVVRILFPNGIPQNIIQPESRQWIYEKQRLLTGSCPYLYTWTGEKYEFFTDLLWAAPIGLQLAEGVLAPAREWEYLKIAGDKLVAQNGEYRLQITEELWEAAYFDSVELIAVDHPADVEIFSNEKVGPAEIAQFKIHTVRQPRTPVSARDQTGRDVLSQLRHKDDVYLKEFHHRIKQGLTPEHYIELDLGKLDDPKIITLFLTGWIFPTDSSINVSLSQNPDLDSPQPPSLWVPDKDGKWQKVMPYMGFPGGKTKTIAVDLSDVFLTNDYRVRIASTMEIYWDHVFFTVDESPTQFRLIPMKPVSADLHYRGFSQRIEHPGHGPESYDYEWVDPEPHWPPMQGKFTRYGDVTELITENDDRLVVLGAGDEMTLRFKVPDKNPPKGWKRDFLLHNVGWDKDASLNTVLGQTVEPLPYRGMQSYPFSPTDSPPDNPQYRDYLRKYQTRIQNRALFWQQIRRFQTKTADQRAVHD